MRRRHRPPLIDFMLEAYGVRGPLIVPDDCRLVTQVSVEHTVPVQRGVGLRLLISVSHHLLVSHAVVGHLWCVSSGGSASLSR